MLLLLLGANFVFALEINYPRVPGAIPPQDFLKTSPPEDILSLYAKYILNLAIWLAGIITLGALIYGGILYLTSTGKPQRMASAKDQITATFFGILILLSSFLILKTLSPQFIILKIPKPEPITVIERPSISPPPTEELRSSINVEIPFGTIIEKGIFEGTVPWEEDKRIPRIYNNAKITEELANKLKDQSQSLKEAADKCSCRQTDPDPACGDNKSGNTTWKCDCGSCSDKESCTCDPCKKVRSDIQNTEQKNLDAIYSGTEISFLNKKGESQKIKTNLIVEQIKTEDEVRLLKEQLGQLERAEKFMLDCYDWIDSLSDFLIKKTNFTENKWPFRKINFWEEILIKGDWATFYCPVSGTIAGEAEYIASAISPETIKELEEAAVTETSEPVEPTACTTDIPVGEIIDRAKRVGYKLVERMEELIELDKKLIDAVDKLQVLISQCSSQRGCERRCTCFGCLCKHHGDCIAGCKGWIYCCADSSGPYPSGCKERDENTPCPYPEIKKQYDEIQKIWQEIKDVIEGKKKNENEEETSEEKIENIGIIQIIEKVVPKILEDLEIIIRERMKDCVTEISSDVSDEETAFENSVLLSNCESSTGGVGPSGVIIQNCCLREGDFQKEFDECLGLCYLQEGEEKYKDCLQKCLEKKAKDSKAAGFKEEAEILETCRHKLNFYCCGG